MLEHSLEFRGVAVHHVELGAPGAPPLLLLHGSGAGASTIGNWRKVLAPLAAAGFHVHAMDLIGFGRSGRKPEPPYFDYGLWLDQCRAMLARIPGERVGLIGHSLSGSLVLRLAATEPRVHRVMTTATMGASFQANPTTLSLWSCPADMHQLRAAARKLIADECLIDAAYLANRAELIFSGDYRQHYDTMFSGDRQCFIDAATLAPEELAAIQTPVLMLHGKEDPGYPAEALSLALARAIPQADVVLLARCSHSVAFEQPEKFLAHACHFFRQEHANG